MQSLENCYRKNAPFLFFLAGKTYIPLWLLRIMDIIFRLMRINRQTCQGRNVRQKSVQPVGFVA